MQIISKRALLFTEWDIREVDGEKVAKAERTYPVKPSVFPQIVPDWCANTDEFDVAQRDGNLTVVKSM